MPGRANCPSQYGTVNSVKVLTKLEDSWSAALVRFASEDEATAVVDGLNGQIPEGLETDTPIKVSFATPKGKGKGYQTNHHGLGRKG